MKLSRYKLTRLIIFAVTVDIVEGDVDRPVRHKQMVTEPDGTDPGENTKYTVKFNPPAVISRLVLTR